MSRRSETLRLAAMRVDAALSAADMRQALDDVADPYLRALVVACRARTRELLRGDGGNPLVKAIVGRFLRAIGGLTP